MIPVTSPIPFSGRACAACQTAWRAPSTPTRRASAAAKPFTFGIFLILAIGCTDTKKPTTQPASWADQAEADPANFNPKMTDPNISGGDLGHFDKNAFDKDLNDVLNP